MLYVVSGVKLLASKWLQKIIMNKIFRKKSAQYANNLNAAEGIFVSEYMQ